MIHQPSGGFRGQASDIDIQAREVMDTKERLSRIKDYPELEKYHVHGLVLVAFTVGRDGTVLNAEVRRSSGYGFIDRAGVDLIRRASPLPRRPFTPGWPRRWVSARATSSSPRTATW